MSNRLFKSKRLGTVQTFSAILQIQHGLQWVEIVSEEVISYSGTCVFTRNSCNVHDCHVTTIKVEEISHQNQLYKAKKISFEKDFNQLY
jgi:hypothetical protein